MIATAAVNTVPTRTGKVRLVCEYCGKLSGARPTAGLFDLPQGWQMTPFPPEYVHNDGSTGAQYSCPTHSRGGAIGHRSREYLDTPVCAAP